MSYFNKRRSRSNHRKERTSRLHSSDLSSISLPLQSQNLVNSTNDLDFRFLRNKRSKSLPTLIIFSNYQDVPYTFTETIRCETKTKEEKDNFLKTIIPSLPLLLIDQLLHIFPVIKITPDDPGKDKPTSSSMPDRKQSLAINKKPSIAIDKKKSIAIDRKKSIALAIDKKKSIIAVDKKKSIAIDKNKPIAIKRPSSNEKRSSSANEKNLPAPITANDMRRISSQNTKLKLIQMRPSKPNITPPPNLLPPPQGSSADKKIKSSPRVIISKAKTASGRIEERAEQTKEPEFSDFFLQKAKSIDFGLVYPRREDKLHTIGTNLVSLASDYNKSRLGLDKKSDSSIPKDHGDEDDCTYCKRNLYEFWRDVVVMPYRWCLASCKTMTKEQNFQEDIRDLYQPRTRNSLSYLLKLKDGLSKTHKDRSWRRTVFECLEQTVSFGKQTMDHLQTLTDRITQFEATLSFSDLYFKDRPTSDEKKLSKGRSVIGAYAWISCYALTQLKIASEKSHKMEMETVKDIFEDLVKSTVYLWTSTCHMISTSEIILNDFEYVIEKYLFNLRSFETITVDLGPQMAYKEQMRVRATLRLIKKENDKYLMKEKAKWPPKKKRPPMPKLNILSRIEGANEKWHPFKRFAFEEQMRIISHFLERAQGITQDAVDLLVDYDSILHTHRPNRKLKETDTLFEDSLVLKDHLTELSAFPRNMLKPNEVEQIYELGRVLSDKIDELYISLYTSKDIVREGLHVMYICSEYMRIHNLWPLEPFLQLSQRLVNESNRVLSHFDKFDAKEHLPPMLDPISLFNSSFYPTLLQTIPVKVAKIFLSLEPSEAKGEPERRRLSKLSSHSIWDALDTIDSIYNTRHKKKKFG